MQVNLKDLDQVLFDFREALGGLFVKFRIEGIARLDAPLDRDQLHRECRPVLLNITTELPDKRVDADIASRDFPQKEHDLETAAEQVRCMARLFYSSVPNLDALIEAQLKQKEDESKIFDLGSLSAALSFWAMGKVLIMDGEDSE